MQPIHF